MTRKSFVDILKNYEINYVQEIAKIEHLFCETRIDIGLYKHYSIQEYINKNLFYSWEYRGTFLSVEEMKQAMLPFLYNNKEVEFDDMLLYFEFISNMFKINLQATSSRFRNLFNTIMENIHTILDKYNYKLADGQDGLLIIVQKSEKVTAVSEIYPSIAPEIIEYNRFSLKGNLKRKRELLLTIAHKFEGIEQKLTASNQKALTENASCLINGLNLRHNTVEGKHASDIVINMPDNELEDWYDRTYDVLLLALMYADYTNYQNLISNLKKKLKTNKA